MLARRLRVLSTFVVLGGALTALLAWASGPSVRGHLPAPPSSSEAARRMVYTAMRNHGRDMQRLVLAVVMLDDEGTAWLARVIGQQPIFTEATRRALRDAGVPSRFFEQAEVLRARAATLEAAAVAHDARAITPAFTGLTETCVACHRAYLGD